MSNEKEIFTYEYSAEQQKEVQEIRKKYESKPSEVSPMDELRKLDRRVQQAGRIPSLLLGTASTLVMGLGMCCTMVWQSEWFIPGLVIGLAGMIGIAFAYPLNNRLVKKRREELSEQILKLTDELMK